MQSLIKRRDGPLHCGVRVLMIVAILVFQLGPAYVMANPQGEQVVAGSASFDRAGNSLTIHTSDRVIIHWQDFSIQSGELTKFVQPSVNSAALNRVISGNPSNIFGTLQANGRIFLINPNGILVGNGARIDTGGFIASTLDVSNEEFLSGGSMTFMGGSMAGVENRGSINAIGGDIFLIAREVKNSGEVNAPGGTVALAAGHEVLIAQAGDDRVFVRPTAGAASAQGISNSGVLAAARVELEAHGNLYALAINNAGTVRANGATIDQDGRVMLTANGGRVINTGLLAANGVSGGSVAVHASTTEIHGQVQAMGSQGAGGTVHVTGERVEVSSASIDVSGATGGGTVNIGGSYQGKDAALQNSQETVVAADATINASATGNGNGGQVVLWSDGTTDFDGTILARGGASGGDGGFAEVSGKNFLSYHGFTDLRADHGVTGTLLLDPKNIAITAAGTDPVAGNSLFSDNAAGWSLISGADLSTAIDTASVTLQANTDIFVNDDVTGTTVGNGLTLQAGRSITIEQNNTISLNEGDFSATINDDAAEIANRDAGMAVFSMEQGSSVLTYGGNVTINHGNLDGTGAGAVRIGIGTANDGAATISSGFGDIDITGTGGSASSNEYGIAVGNGSQLLAISGDIILNGTGGAGTTLNHGVTIQDSGTKVQAGGGSILITGQGGAGSQELNFGVNVADGAQISSVGPGNITLIGTGGLGAWGNHGVSISGSGTSVTTEDGNISLTGTGADAGGGFNVGVRIDGDLDIETTGVGSINIVGNGGNGGANGDNWGVLVQGGGAPANAVRVATAGRDISISGTGDGTTDQNNYGVYLNQNVEITSTGVADIIVSGWGSDSAAGIKSSNGVLIGGPSAFHGTITLEADIPFATDAIDLSNTTLQGDGTGGTVFLQPINGNFSIGVAGGAGFYNLSASELDGIQDGFTQIYIGRTDNTGTGTISVGSYTFNASVYMLTTLPSDVGTINISGDLATSDPGDFIRLEAGKTVTISGGSVTTNNGDILIKANPSGTYAAWSMGVDLNNGALVSAGTGAITIKGTGGQSGGDWKIGVRVQGSSIETTSGGIDIDGVGGDSDSFNPGILVEWGGGQIKSDSGNIIMEGIGGGTGQNNWGISVSDGGAVFTGGNGDLELNGMGGSGTDINYGVRITGGGLVSAESGRVIIQGSGGPAATGQWNHGVNIDTGGQIIITDGTLQLQGNGGSLGTLENLGTRIADSGTLIQTGDGDIEIKGFGGGGSAEGHRGTVIEGGADIVSTGAGTMFLSGIAGGTQWGNHGLVIAGAGTTVSGVDGDISLRGVGADSSGGWNNGTWIFQGAVVEATGSAGLHIYGSGGNAGANGDNWGIMLEDAGTKVSVADGNMWLEAYGNGTTDQNNIGLYARDNAQIESTGSGGILLQGSGNNTAPGVSIDTVSVGGGSMTGDLTIQAETFSGSDSISLSNTTFQSSGQLFLSSLSVTETVGLAGENGVFNLSSAELDMFQNGFSKITIGRNDGMSQVSVGSYTFNDPIKIQSNAASFGVVYVPGALDVSTPGDSIELYGGRGVVINGNVTTDGGDITIRGNPTNAPNGFSFGVDINGVIVSSGTGDIDIIGIGGNDTAFDIGIRVTSGGVLQTTSGNITLDGTGGPAVDNNWGVVLEWNSLISTSSGNISITGASQGTGNDNNGVMIQGLSSISSNTGDIDIMGTGSTVGNSYNHGVKVDFSSIVSTDGDISITGQGGGTGSDNYGILFQNGSTIDSLGLATITLDGTGGDGTWWNVGTYIVNAGTVITSAVGDVEITGTGGDGLFSENTGILLSGGAVINSTDTAQITMTGTGGAGTWGNHGIQILDPGTAITTVDGDINIAGFGGADGTDGWNVGVRIQNGPSIDSAGLAEIDISGFGGAGVSDNWGFWMNAASVTTLSAGIFVNGTGGDGSGTTNYGIFMENGAYIDNFGAGDVTVTGTGGDADWGNHGVLLTGLGTEVCVEDGNLLILGNGGNGIGGWNTGVRIDDFAMVEACNNGTVTIQGIGGNGTDDNWGIQANNGSVTSIVGDITMTGLGNGSGSDNHGIFLEGATSIISYDTANITLDGRGAGAAEGIETTGAVGIGGPAMTGDITLIADTVAGADSIDLAGVTLEGAGAVFLQPLNNPTSMGLGGGAGTFNLSNAELAALQDGFSGITIGRTTGTGVVEIGAATFVDSISIYGGATTITGPLDAGFDDLLVKASGSVTLAGTVTAGNATLVTSSSFINTAGATPITLNGGRFLIYSVKPQLNTLGGLVFDFEKFGMSFPAVPGAAGNGLVYSDPGPGSAVLDNFMNTTFQQFSDSYDRINRLWQDYLNMPNYYPGGSSISYDPSIAMPEVDGALAQLSSFDFSEQKKPGQGE